MRHPPKTRTLALITALCCAQAAAAVELNLYHSPRIFPHHLYYLLMLVARTYLSTLMPLIYLVRGGAPTGALSTVAPGLLRSVRLLSTCLAQAAAVLAGEVQYADALCTLDALEQELQGMYTLQPLRGPATFAGRDTPRVAGNSLLAVTAQTVIFSCAARVRCLYLALPEVVSTWQPDARAARHAHFHNFGRWNLRPPKLATLSVSQQTPQHSLAEAAAASPRGAAAEALPASSSGHGGKDDTPNGIDLPLRGQVLGRSGDAACSAPESPSSVQTAMPQSEQPKSGLSHLLYRAGALIRWVLLLPLAVPAVMGRSGTAEHAALALQTAVAMAVAVVLHVCPASYNALYQSTLWIAFTVAVTSQFSRGGILMRGVNRMLGTAVGGLAGLG